MVKDCGNLAANIAESLRQLYCSSAARFTRSLFFLLRVQLYQMSSEDSNQVLAQSDSLWFWERSKL